MGCENEDTGTETRSPRCERDRHGELAKSQTQVYACGSLRVCAVTVGNARPFSSTVAPTRSAVAVSTLRNPPDAASPRSVAGSVDGIVSFKWNRVAPSDGATVTWTPARGSRRQSRIVTRIAPRSG